MPVHRPNRLLVPLALVILTVMFLGLNLASAESVDEKWQRDMQKDYQKVLDADKQQPERHRGLVSKWRERDHLDALVELYQADAGKPDAYVQYGLGYALTVQRQYQAALPHLKRAVELASDMALGYYTLGSVQRELGQYAEAEASLLKCVQLDPKLYLAYYHLGEVYRLQEKLPQAKAAYQQAVELRQKWEVPYYGLAQVFLLEGDTDSARMNIERVLKYNGKFSPAYYLLGQIHALEGNADKAFAVYEAGTAYQPPGATDWQALAHAFEQMDAPAEAVQAYEHALQIASGDAGVHFELAGVLYAMGQTDAAVEHYRQVVAGQPELLEQFLEQARLYEAGLTTADAARIALTKYLLLYPEHAEAHVLFGRIEQADGHPELALRHYERALTSDPARTDLYLTMANLYYQLEQMVSAVEFYRKAIEIDPTLRQQFFGNAQTAFESGSYPDALKYVTKYLLLFPDDIPALLIQARTQTALGKSEDAFATYRQILTLDPENREALWEVGYNHQQQGSPGEVVGPLSKLIDLQPNHIAAHFIRSLCYEALERQDEAIAGFREVLVLSQSPDSVITAGLSLPEMIVDSHEHLGRIYEAQGAPDAAILEYEETVRLDNQRSDAFLRLGQIYLGKQQKEEAIRTLSAGLALDPPHAQDQFDLAVLLEEANQAKDALEHYALANQYDDTNLEWHFRYARLLDIDAGRMNDFDTYAAKAVEEYTRAIQLNLNYAPAYYYRGLICRRYKTIGGVLYRYDQIAEDFRQVTELEPKNADAFYQLALTYLDLDRKQEAESAFRRVASLNSKYRGMNLQLGKLAEWHEQFKDAIHYYEAEIALDSSAVEAYQRVGQLYTNYSLEFDKAMRAFRRALEFDPRHVPTLINYGQTFYQMDQLGAAAEQFERALQIAPENLTANFNLALMYEYLDKKQLAIDRWERLIALDPPGEWKRQAQEHLDKLKR